MKEKLTVIKVGGKVVEQEDTLLRLLNDFAHLEGHKVLVHGGGRSATQLAGELGVETRMVEGRRITDAAMLRIVTMVYGGLVNKNLVARLQALGVNALGLTGADMDLIRADRRPVREVDYGFVGDVSRVDSRILSRLIEQGVVPVVAPLSHDGKGSLLNTNADTIAQEVAVSLSEDFEVTLIYCFEKKGVLGQSGNEDSVIPEITASLFQELVQKGIVQDGMIPKLENAFKAIGRGVSEVIITSAQTFLTDGGTHIR